MKTLDLQQAAAFLRMNPETLRQKTKAEIIPGAKPGKSWVYVEEDLVEYLRSLYPTRRRAVQVPDGKEIERWHCTDVVKCGMHTSAHPAAKELESLLKRKTA